MKRAFACVAVVLGMVASGCSPAPAAPAAMVAAADALDDAFVAAFNKGDVDGLNGLYWNSADVMSFGVDSSAKGIAAVRDANAKTIAGMKGAQLELTERHNVPLGEAVAGYGTFRMTVPGGAPIVGRYSDVKAERDGKWVYIIDHASVPPPPAP